MIASSSKAWTKTRSRSRWISRAFCIASSKVWPWSSTSAPHRFVAEILTSGVGSGMTISAFVSTREAAKATPWA